MMGLLKRFAGMGMIALIAVFDLASCSNSASVSRVKIDSGESINQNSANKVDGVFITFTTVIGSNFGNSCSGTAVSTNTVMTAGHCVYAEGEKVGPNYKVLGKKFCVSNAIYDNICSSEIYVNPTYPAHSRESNGGHDFAFVVFPKDTFKAYFRVSTDSVRPGDSVLFVGYSEANLEQGASKKRFGYNKVSGLLGSHRNDIFSDYGHGFENVAVSPGDSGGPLFKSCEITGVASRMDEDNSPKVSIHTNLTHPLTVQTFRSAPGGAYFCGLSGDDEAYCPKAAAYGVKPGLVQGSKEFPCEVDSTGTTPPVPPKPQTNTMPLFAALNESGDLLIRGAEPISSAYVCVGSTESEAKACSTKVDAYLDGLNFKTGINLPTDGGSVIYVDLHAIRQSDGTLAEQMIQITRKS
jgi:V8-like Glu-specific endopeptidase